MKKKYNNFIIDYQNWPIAATTAVAIPSQNSAVCLNWLSITSWRKNCISQV